ncbi:LysR family transcriptional regulator [Halomonas denitrificans]|uniref:LysR family transcriptional regulator n=1 Tax=Halomonas TaxID=2745 RepID=UPI001A8D3354|nr:MULTISPECIES: LysR family transcriptional regulator [Halomonas]MED5295163.1 LysR family transcriptional regulator [Pseudomonadota bacterium]MBN8412980.1 LysR family transcriptional regulator [Halomonas litopenaei]MBY5929110.1 LysR family transcriptional regulator [Halomonas sp. DP8Y7-3]MBY5968203.1 LysR family transcriptional regulator [Halomonas denitrificans]MBY5983696.1 LysR family transcriptional regulator [Halomonas sp. DP5Y7-2]
MLNGRALAYLCEVQRRGSLRGAAIHLNVDVSAISRLIRRQEEELSIPLLTRHPDGVTLTEAGRLLVEHHRARCDAETATLSRLSALQSLDSGEVRVAVGEGFIADLVNAPLQTFMTAHAGIDIVVVMAGVNEAMALVRDREVDLALLYAPPMDPLLRCHVERRHPLDLIVPADHPLTRRQAPLTLAEISDWPLGLMDSPFGMRQMVDQVAHQERLHLRSRLHTNSVTVLRNFVRSGSGVTFMPELTVADDIAQGLIQVLPLAHPVLNGARAQIVSRQGRPLPVAAEACLAHLRRGMRFFADDAPRLLAPHRQSGVA